MLSCSDADIDLNNFTTMEKYVKINYYLELCEIIEVVFLTYDFYFNPDTQKFKGKHFALQKFSDALQVTVLCYFKNSILVFR